MRVNSDEALRRAIRYREQQGGRSWLELTREPSQQRNSRDFFSGVRHERPSPHGVRQSFPKG